MSQDDDDDDFIVVSTRQQKWERLNNDEDDDLIVKVKEAVRPWDDAPGNRLQRMVHAVKRRCLHQNPLQFTTVFALCAIVLLYWYHCKRRKTITRKQEPQQNHDSATARSKTTQEEPTKATTIHTVDHTATTLQQESTGDTTTIVAESPPFSQQSSLTTKADNGDHKVQRIHQMAQDLQLVQDVLQTHDLDPALAPHIALTLQSTEIHRELHYQQAVLHHHQKHLDRQLSQQQHRESLQAVKYDPNWEEKLVWNVNVTHVWWKVFGVQQLVRGVVPLAWKWYYSDDSDFLWKQLAWSILAHVCECKETTAVSTNDVTLATKIAASAVAMEAMEYNHHSLAAVVMLLLKSWIPLDLLDQCTCYGYCLMAGCLLLVIASFLHYLLRLLSLPAFCHHVVNGMSFVTFVGTYRIVAGVQSAMTILVLGGTENGRMDAASALELVLLFFMLVLQPVVSYIQTQRLYSRIKTSIRNADSSEFEATFRRGQQALKGREWEDQVTLSICLSLYAALLMMRRP